MRVQLVHGRHPAALQELQRVIRVLCLTCGPKHVLDNERVWGMCGAQRLISSDANGYGEDEIRDAIRSLPDAPLLARVELCRTCGHDAGDHYGEADGYPCVIPRCKCPAFVPLPRTPVAP